MKNLCSFFFFLIKLVSIKCTARYAPYKLNPSVNKKTVLDEESTCLDSIYISEEQKNNTKQEEKEHKQNNIEEKKTKLSHSNAENNITKNKKAIATDKIRNDEYENSRIFGEEIFSINFPDISDPFYNSQLIYQECENTIKVYENKDINKTYRENIVINAENSDTKHFTADSTYSEMNLLQIENIENKSVDSEQEIINDKDQFLSDENNFANHNNSKDNEKLNIFNAINSDNIKEFESINEQQKKNFNNKIIQIQQKNVECNAPHQRQKVKLHEKKNIFTNNQELKSNNKINKVKLPQKSNIKMINVKNDPTFYKLSIESINDAKNLNKKPDETNLVTKIKDNCNKKNLLAKLKMISKNNMYENFQNITTHNETILNIFKVEPDLYAAFNHIINVIETININFEEDLVCFNSEKSAKKENPKNNTESLQQLSMNNQKNNFTMKNVRTDEKEIEKLTNDKLIVIVEGKIIINTDIKNGFYNSDYFNAIIERLKLYYWSSKKICFDNSKKLFLIASFLSNSFLTGKEIEKLYSKSYNVFLISKSLDNHFHRIQKNIYTEKKVPFYYRKIMNKETNEFEDKLSTKFLEMIKQLYLDYSLFDFSYFIETIDNQIEENDLNTKIIENLVNLSMYSKYEIITKVLKALEKYKNCESNKTCLYNVMKQKCIDDLYDMCKFLFFYSFITQFNIFHNEIKEKLATIKQYVEIFKNADLQKKEDSDKLRNF